jgi:ribosomal protein S18 acetylase RimI-like enzyme
VGAALVNAALRQAAAAGARRVVLSTLPQMHVAHRLYERAGFRRLPDRDWRPRPDVTLLAYSLDLPASDQQASDLSSGAPDEQTQALAP